MDSLTVLFDERLQEIDAYLDLLDALEQLVRKGPPKIGDVPITAQQQKILYSSVYLQLYNLVEATVTWCMDAVAAASANGGHWQPRDLSDELRREWVRTIARTHVEMSKDNRWRTAIEFCERLLLGWPVAAWAIEKGGGGNWDDNEIEEISERLGCELRISAEVRTGIKRIIREDKGALALVKFLRNNLAHGRISFADCGDGVTVSDLRDIRQRAADYLREVVKAFRDYIDGHMFLAPSRRPGAT